MNNPEISTPWRGGVSAALWVVVAALWSGAAPGVDSAAGENDRVVEQRRKLETVRERIQATLDTLDEKRKTQKRLNEQLRDLELKVQDRRRALRDARQRARAAQTELSALEKRRAELQENLDANRQRLAGQIRAEYFTGSQEHLKLLLNQQDPAALARTLKYYEYLNKARVTTIEQTRSTLSRLAETEKAIARETAALERLSTQRENEYQKLQAARKERATLVGELGAEIEDHLQSVETLRRDENRIRELIGRLTGLFADIPPEAAADVAFAEHRGRLPWPVDGQRLNAFGQPRTGSDMVWHGIRIAAPGGEDVRAVSHGRVAFADWLPGFGLVLIVDHNEGYMSLYAHNEALYKETGDWVAPSEVIASVGNTGGRQRSALYFEIRHNGKPVDPATWCRSRQS